MAEPQCVIAGVPIPAEVKKAHAILAAARGGLTRNDAKRAVRVRDGGRCTKCGMANEAHVEQTGAALEVHRITPGSVYAPEGCVLLCRTCHAKEPKSAPGGLDVENGISRWYPGTTETVVIDPLEGDWITVDEAHELVGNISRRRIQALAKSGRVKAKNLLGRILLERDSLAAWMKSPDRKPGRPRKNP